MIEYQRRIEGLLREINSKVSQKGAFKEIEKAFTSHKIFSHSHVSSFFCDPTDIRIRKESVLIAAWLIDEKFQNIDVLIKKAEQNLYNLSIEYEADNLFYQHVASQLLLLKHRKDLQKKILQMGIPIFNPWSEKIVRSGVRLSKREKITEAHVQTLVLSVFLHPLRQNVGSCFATAPAIIIQKEQPERLLSDLEDLLHVGILKRTYGGEEHAVPISTSWGPGILNKVIEVNGEDCLWESSELIHCLSELQILPKKESQKSKQNHLKKIIQSALKLGKEKKRVSLLELLKGVLQTHYNIKEKELSSFQPKVDVQAGQLGLSLPSSRANRYFDALKEAEYLLISYHENPLLKTWEYTFASFAETRSQFYKWNLYTSLGFDSKKPHSVAHCIYQYLEEQLKVYEEKIKHHDQEYEQEFYRVKMLEKRVVDTESEHAASWAKVEYQNHLNEFNFHHKMRDSFIGKSERLSELLSKILKTYDQIFPQYFQEVYDASMQEVNEDIFEDSPAGFRLIYKHGRQDPSLWSFVRSKEDFVSYLKEFFVNTEFEISSQEELKEFKEEYSQIITRLIHLIQSDDFMIGAYHRIAQRYQIPFPTHDISQVDKWPFKPWCYISGGAMERLLKHYYKREQDFTTAKQKIANPTELFSFIIETTRSITPDQIDQYHQDPQASLLMYSPNHAYIFKPGWLPLKEIWDQKEYSYSWIRDQVVYPQLRFIQSIKVSPLEINFFLNTYLAKHPYFSLWLKENTHWPSYAISLLDFRNQFEESFKDIPHNLTHLSMNLELIDSWIYQCFPLTQGSELSQVCQSIIESLINNQDELKRAKHVLEELLKSYKSTVFVQPIELYELLKVVVSMTYEKVAFSHNWPQQILTALREHHKMMPKPFVFADTNWPQFHFSFTVNPATEKLELWRTCPLAYQGYPMHQWDKWFSEKEPQAWGILNQKKEYL